jgi:hypothetical protein
MAETLNKLIVDCSTGEETLVPLTDDEIADLENLQKEADERRAAQQAELEALETAKASALAKLTALGLTEEEAKAIAG